MRLIDADRLHTQIEAASYPMKSGMLRLIEAAPTAMEWHDAKQEMLEHRSESHFFIVSANWSFYVCDYHDGYFWRSDETINQWVRMEPEEIEQWFMIPYPPDCEV